MVTDKTKIALFALLSVIVFVAILFFYQKQLTQMTLINDSYKADVANQDKQIGKVNTKLVELSTKLKEAKISNEQLNAKINSMDVAMNSRSKRWIKVKRVRAIAKKTMTRLGKYSNRMNIIALTRYAGAVVDSSNEYDVPIPLILAVTRQESAFNPKAVSHAGAKGLMQLMPRTAQECADDIGRRYTNIFDVGTNVRLGTYYLRKMLTRFDEDTELAIKAYNAGPNYVSKVLANIYSAYPDETINYSKKVLEYLEEYQASYN